MRVKIYTVSHKDQPHAIRSDVFEPITVGRGVGQDMSDDKMFGELCAHYEIWRTMPDVDFVGFMHYRRWLLLPPRYIPDGIFGDMTYLSPGGTQLEFYIGHLQRLGNDDFAVLEDLDVYCARPWDWNIGKQFRQVHGNLAGDALSSVMPNGFSPSAAPVKE